MSADQLWRMRGSALVRKVFNSDGKPCSGVRGNQQVSTDLILMTAGKVCQIQGEATLSTLMPFLCKQSLKECRTNEK